MRKGEIERGRGKGRFAMDGGRESKVVSPLFQIPLNPDSPQGQCFSIE